MWYVVHDRHLQRVGSPISASLWCRSLLPGGWKENDLFYSRWKRFHLLIVGQLFYSPMKRRRSADMVPQTEFSCRAWNSWNSKTRSCKAAVLHVPSEGLLLYEVSVADCVWCDGEGRRISTSRLQRLKCGAVLGAETKQAGEWAERSAVAWPRCTDTYIKMIWIWN